MSTTLTDTHMNGDTNGHIDSIQHNNNINGNHTTTNDQPTRAEQLVQELLTRCNALISNVGRVTPYNKSKSNDNTKHNNNSTNKKARNGGIRRNSIDDGDDSALLEVEILEDDLPPTIMTHQPRLVTGGELRNYQLEGLNWLIRLFHSHMSGILADEMGLGKTLQTISMLAYLKEYYDDKSQGPHLVLTPLSTLGNWDREFARFAPSIRVLKFHGSKDERADMKSDIDVYNRSFDVFLTSYEMALKEKSLLNKFKWQYIIIDEAHRLKNENSILSQIVRMFHSDIRLLLTGTPLQNNLHELWALLNFLVPDLFSNSAEFDEMFAVDTTSNTDITQDEKSKAILSTLHTILRPFMLRRLKSQVATDLPPKYETLVTCPMTELQQRVYKGVLIKDLEVIQGGVKERSRLMNIMMQLRKAANHPYLFEGVEDRSLNPYDTHLVTNCGKMIVLDKLLTKLKNDGHRVLIFAQMTSMIDILEDYCLYKQYQYCRIDGNTPQPDRETAMKVFNEPGSEKFLFLLSTRAGGLGINLWTADTVILYDSDWNPQMDLQAMDRAHRIGQTKQVNVYRLMTESTVEEKILERAAIKMNLDKLVVNRDRDAAKKSSGMSNEDVVNMVRFGADKIFKSIGSDFADEDIDIILQRGEQKTKELNEKTKSQAATLANLTFDATSPPIQLVENVDLEIPSDLIGLALDEQTAALGRRKAAQLAETNNRYRDTLSSTKLMSTRNIQLVKPHRIPRMYEHQFFNIQRIHELNMKEIDFYEHHEYDTHPPALHGLSDDENNELNTLLQSGFSDWSWSDYHQFLRGCRRYGRHNINKIAQYVGKSVIDVERYHKHWFEHYNELKAGKALMSRLERAEIRVNKFAEFQQLLDSALSEYKTKEQILHTLPIRYTQMQKDKGYTLYEDRFMLYGMRELGYGQFKALIKMIRNEPTLKFDYWILSRTSLELQRRVNALCRLLGKQENEPNNPNTTQSRSKKRNAKQANLPVSESIEFNNATSTTTTTADTAVQQPVKKQATIQQT